MTQKILKLFYFLRRKAKISLFFALPFWLIVFAFSVYAATYTRVPAGQIPFVPELMEDVNNKCSNDIFVPLNTASERNSFVNNSPNQCVVFGYGSVCLPTCIKLNWEQTFNISGANSGNFSFSLPNLKNVSSYSSAISNPFTSAVPGFSTGFGSAFLNQSQSNSLNVSYSSPYRDAYYPVVNVCDQYGWASDGSSSWWGCVASHNEMVINGQAYSPVYVCDQYGWIYAGSYEYWGCVAGARYEAGVPFSGTVTVTGDRSGIFLTTIGPITGIGDASPIGTFLCPSGTFVHGMNLWGGAQIRNDWPHIVIQQIYCAESFGMTTDTIVRDIALFGGGGGTCAQDEYIKGFSSFGVSSDWLWHSQLSYMHCAKLVKPSPQAAADAFYMYTYGTGPVSAGLGSDYFRAIVGLVGGWDYGPGGARGPRFYPSYFYTRPMPSPAN